MTLFGNTPSYKAPHLLRFISQNINTIVFENIATNLVSPKIFEYKNLKPDVLLLQETNKNLSTHKCKQSLETAYRSITSSPKTDRIINVSSHDMINMKARGPCYGGTSQIAGHFLASRFLKKHSDSLGRFTACQYSAPDKRTLLVISAYCPVKLNKSKQNSCSYLQHIYLRTEDPPKRMITDLSNLLSSFDSTRTDKILGIDANQKRSFDFSPHSGTIGWLMQTHNLLDPLELLHGEVAVSTCDKSTRQQRPIDFLLCSQRFLPYIA